MTAMTSLLVVALVLAAPATARALTLFDFQWTSSATFSTLIPVNREEPDGTVTPYDEVRRSGTLTGSGTLALTLPSATADGYTFQFSGPAGSGAGQALPGGQILPGQFTFALPADVPVTPGVDALSGGTLTLQGNPAQPSGIAITYFESTSPHCLFDCSSVTFTGFGQARGAAVAAAEPADAVLAALGLLGAAWLGARGRAGA